MKIQTKIPVRWCVPGKFYQVEETIVVGELFNESTSIPSMDKTFQYRYASDSGQVIMTGSKTFTASQIAALYELVKDDLPDGLNYPNKELYLFYYGFLLEFSSTVNTDVANVEIVN
jgi:hypothetical protein